MLVNFAAQHGLRVFFNRGESKEKVLVEELPKSGSERLELPEDNGIFVSTVNTTYKGGREISQYHIYTRDSKVMINSQEVKEKIELHDLHVSCERL